MDIPTAIKLVTEIIDKTIILKQNPFLGQEEKLLSERPQNFRYIVSRNHKIIYWFNENKNHIEIANVFDCRQNPIKITKM